MKWCAWKGVRVSCASIFTMFPTDRGMCCSFNMQRAEEMFRDSKYKELITKFEQRDKNMSFDNSTIPEWSDILIMRNEVAIRTSKLSGLMLGQNLGD